ncbi:MAG: phosphoglucosamine mutase [bacterium]|nr:phosphoglucosamine mutase [bacterium]
MSTSSEPIISVSGLRGILGTQLTAEVAMRFVSALAAGLPPGKVVIGRDGRRSGIGLSQAVSATLIGHGLSPVELGVAATPTVGVEVRRNQAVAGIQISASHNPREYNGLKLFGADGRVLTKVSGERILAAYRSRATAWVSESQLGQSQTVEQPHRAHGELVLSTVDVDSIRRRKFRVLLDSNHGAGSLLGRWLLEQLGCQVNLLGDVPDGAFSHAPEPTAENLQPVAKLLAHGNYDVGFCQDPDADRLAVIDETGAYIGEEMTLALCLKQLLPKQQGTIVTNCATSGLSRVLAAQFDCKLLQSAVGEANVADLMLAEQAIFGGEGNGGPIDPKVGYVRDSFVGMARILDLLAHSQHSLSQHVAELPALSIAKDKSDVSQEALPELFECLTAHFPDAQTSRLDGLKLDWGDRWLLVRGSNTEPIVRYIAEAPTLAEAQQLCETAKDVAASCT